MNRSVIYFLATLLAALLVLTYYVAEPFLGPGIFAALIAIAFRPIHQRLAARVKHPGIAAGITTALAFVFILVPIVIVMVTISKEVSQSYRELQTISAPSGGIRAFLLNHADQIVGGTAKWAGLPEPEVAGKLQEFLEAASQWLVGAIAAILKSIGTMMVNAVLSAVVLFFFLRDGEKIREAIVDLLPLKRSDCDELAGVIAVNVAANFYGVLGVAAAQGILTGIGFALVGIGSTFTWGAIAGFASMIPFIGPALVWAPAALYLLSEGSTGAALFLAIWGVVAVGLSDNILRPIMVMGQTNQHPLLVFLSIIGGTHAFGLMGLFLGPLIISILIAVFGVLRREMADVGN
jgi:predicted PurR-regulated permease PerM